jgi:hypothetical protein
MPVILTFIWWKVNYVDLSYAQSAGFQLVNTQFNPQLLACHLLESLLLEGVCSLKEEMAWWKSDRLSSRRTATFWYKTGNIKHKLYDTSDSYGGEYKDERQLSGM